MTGLLLATLAVFLLAVLAMAVGVLLSGRCLRGSCGGSAGADPGGKRLSCLGCPNRTRET